MVLAVKLNVCPTQTGLLLPAVGAAGEGAVETVTVLVTAGHIVTSVTFTVYVPTPTEMEEVVAPVLHE